MKRFQIDMREVLVHEFTIEALSKDDAIARIYDEDLEADYINPICYEVDDIQEMKSDSDYDKSRTENLDWLQGKK